MVGFGGNGGNGAATAALHDPTQLAFRHLVSANDLPTRSLAVTGFVAHGAVIDDVAGNHADVSGVAATFSALSINRTTVAAYTVNGFTRPELALDQSGHIIPDDAAMAAASLYGTKFLYVGLPASTPVGFSAHDFHLV